MKIPHSKIIGSGSNHLIILHGLLGMGDNWKTIANKLSEYDYKIHLLDQRNHGKSFHSNIMNYDVMTSDVYNYLNHKKINKCDILGHSMGGKVAINFSLHYSEFVRKMIIVDIAPRQYEPKFNYLFEIMSNLDLANFSSRSEIQNKLNLEITNKSLVLFLLKNISRDNNNQFKFKPNIDILHKSLTILMDQIFINKKININTTFIKGEKSNYINDSDVIFINNYFKNSQLIEIKNSGHWVHSENPKDFLSSLIHIFNN